MVGFKHFQLDFNQIRTDNKAFIEYFRLNHQILSSLLKTPELIGMKNFSIQHRTGGAKCKETAANCCKLLLTAANCC